LNMNGYRVTGVPNPSLSNDATPKSYVDAAPFLPLGGGVVAGIVTIVPQTPLPSLTLLPAVGSAPPSAQVAFGSGVTSSSIVAQNMSGSLSLEVAGAGVGIDLQGSPAKIDITAPNTYVSGQLEAASGLFIPNDPVNVGGVSFYQANQGTFTFTPGANGLQFDMTTTQTPPNQYYNLQRGYTSLFINRAPNTSSPATNYLTFPDPDLTWLGTEIDIVLSGTGNANNRLTMACLNDNAGIQVVSLALSQPNLGRLGVQPLSTQVVGNLVWSTLTTDQPMTGLLGLCFWNRSINWDGGDGDIVAYANGLSNADMVFNVKCKRVWKQGSLGFCWVITGVSNSYVPAYI
jgi:hypothetical protein